jgi:hypothetical protein
MSRRSITTRRGVQLSLAVINLGVGVALALFMNHYIRDFRILLARQWYDSYWLPLSVAVLFYAVEAAWVQLPADWLYGLLITGPPYGWHAFVATLLYIENKSEVALSAYLKVALPALLLALSGAVLNPVISRLVAQFKAKTEVSPTH